jgi:hypothetical protein
MKPELLGINKEKRHRIKKKMTRKVRNIHGAVSAAPCKKRECSASTKKKGTGLKKMARKVRNIHGAVSAAPCKKRECSASTIGEKRRKNNNREKNIHPACRYCWPCQNRREPGWRGRSERQRRRGD